MIKDNDILNVNNKSNIIGGMGKIITPITKSIKNGIPIPNWETNDKFSDLKFDMLISLNLPVLVSYQVIQVYHHLYNNTF